MCSKLACDGIEVGSEGAPHIHSVLIFAERFATKKKLYQITCRTGAPELKALNYTGAESEGRNTLVHVNLCVSRTRKGKGGSLSSNREIYHQSVE